LICRATLLRLMQDCLIDLDGLRSFVAVADRLNFAQAAAALRISAPAMTRRIQRLERAIGVPLLERSTRQVVVTAEGEHFLGLAREATAAVDRAADGARALAASRAGNLVLACVPTMTYQVLPRIIRAFHAVCPQVRVRVIECGVGAVERAVREDVAVFGFGFPVQAGGDAELAFKAILTDPYCLVLPPDHPLAAFDRVAWQALKPHRVITAGQQSGNMQVLNRALKGVDWRPVTKYEVDHLTTSLGLVEAGLGIAVVPRSALPTAMPAAMITRELVEPSVTRTLGVFRRRNAAMGHAHRQFLSVARRVA
jgi:DNA-binding transcriptional LysR family regulator